MQNGTTLHRAEFIYTPNVREPILDGAVLVSEDGTVLDIGPIDHVSDRADAFRSHQILMPGVVNAHVHLTDAAIEDPVPGGDGLVRWVDRLLDFRRDAEISQAESVRAIAEVLGTMAAAGTVGIGEVSNDPTTFDDVVRQTERHAIQLNFILELIGFRREVLSDRRQMAGEFLERSSGESTHHYSLGAHAPYSTSPELVNWVSDTSRTTNRLWYEHLAEDPDERELYRDGSGRWRLFLEEMGVWEPEFAATGQSPIERYEHMGILTPEFVAVHLTDASPAEIDLLSRRDVGVILSPTSNLHITGRLPDVERISNSGMRIALGTDGRGSNPSVDVFDEARSIAEHFPHLEAGVLLRALTSGGAELSRFNQLGSFETGKRPGLVAIETGSVRNSSMSGLERAILFADYRTRVVPE